MSSVNGRIGRYYRLVQGNLRAGADVRRWFRSGKKQGGRTAGGAGESLIDPNPEEIGEVLRCHRMRWTVVLIAMVLHPFMLIGIPPPFKPR
jgi:hypothetical protein